MRKRLLPGFVIAALAICAVVSTPASARWFNPATSGYCAWGTCNRLGGIRAANIRRCRAEYCRDFIAVSLKTIGSLRKASCRGMPEMTTSWIWPRRDCGVGQ